jgi:hypothetical protein
MLVESFSTIITLQDGKETTSDGRVPVYPFKALKNHYNPLKTSQAKSSTTKRS